MTPTRPGVVVLELGNQSGVTIVDMANPAREYDSAPDALPPARVKRKYTRRHLDKQRHEAHEDKHEEEDPNG